MAKKPGRKPKPDRGPRSNSTIITTTDKGGKPTPARPAKPKTEQK